MKFILIKTTRFSTVIRAFVEKYPDAEVRLDRKLDSRPLAEWCTRKTLTSLVDFSLAVNDRNVLAFHDDSRELHAPYDQLSFVEELAEKKMLRFEVVEYEKRKPGLWARLFSRKG
jgi:hypothetical protein